MPLSPTPWTFDGWGVNDGSEYKARIATLTKGPDNEPRGRSRREDGLLLAAAPDMLRALKWLSEQLASDGKASAEEMDAVAKAAIAKAEGRG